jgi:hypothetical protein
MYYIARIVDGNWQVLDNMPTYSDAEMMIDAYRNLYQDSYVEIVSNTHFEVGAR